MKKALATILSALIVLSAAALASCDGSAQPANASQPGSSAQATEAATENPDDVKDKNLTYAEFKDYKLETGVPVKNIILMIGDGMGLNAIKCAEIQKGGKFATAAMPYTAQVTTDPSRVQQTAPPPRQRLPAVSKRTTNILAWIKTTTLWKALQRPQRAMA